MRWTFPVCIGLGLGALPALAQTPPADTFALVGVRIEVGDGHVIEKATILLRHGLIAAVGPDVKVPADAEVIKGDGLTVYPGFIDGQMVSGFTLPAAQPDQDRAPDSGAEAPASMRLANRKGVRPEMRAADYLTLTEAALGPIRQAGFTTALVAPSGGSISGVSALVNLSGAPKRDAVVRPAVTMGLGFGGGGSGLRFNFDPAAARPSGTGYPGSLLGYIALLRQTLLDAQYYRSVDTAFSKGAGQRPPADDSLLALQSVLDGSMPVVFDADSDNQIIRAMNIADEFGLKLIVGGGGDAWKLAPTLAKKQIPVLVSLNFGEEPGVSKAPAGPPGMPGAPGGGRPGGRPGGGGRRGNRAPADPAAPPEAAAGSPTAPPVAPGGNPANPPVVPSGKQAVPPVAPDGKQPVPPAAPGGNTAVPPVAPGAIPTVPPGIPGDNPVAAPDALPTGTPSAAIVDDEDETPKAVVAEQHRKWEEKVANAAKLQSAGVPFVFTTRGVRTPAEFMDNLRKAIKAGLSRSSALKALTLNAAKLYSVDRQMGTVEAGKIADLVVMSGDFADPKTKVRYVFIDKSKFDLENDRPSSARPPFAFPGLGEDDDR